MDSPKIYVGTYGKYAAGSIEGQWINLEDFTNYDEFINYCEKIHGDEDDPEFMFQDHEGIPKIFITESHLRRDFWEFMDQIDEWDEGTHEAFDLWCKDTGYEFAGQDVTEAIEQFEDAYEGFWGKSFSDPKINFAEELFDEAYMPEIPDRIKGYIDYEKFSDDLFCGDFWEEKGHVFQRI